MAKPNGMTIKEQLYGMACRIIKLIKIALGKKQGDSSHREGETPDSSLSSHPECKLFKRYCES